MFSLSSKVLPYLKQWKPITASQFPGIRWVPQASEHIPALCSSTVGFLQCPHLVLRPASDRMGFMFVSAKPLKTKQYPPKHKRKYVHIPLVGRLYEKRYQLEADIKALTAHYSMASLVSKTPDRVRPYLELARIDKPIGTWLLYLPCVFGICMATPPGELPSFYYLALFGVGSFLMRGAGCTINDLWDKDFDKLVDRTKNRPITSGQISQSDAIKFLAFQLSLSLGILLSLNTACIMMGIAAMVPVVLYPLAKRFTMVPQAVLGLTFNIGALMGYAAVSQTLDWTTMGMLYASCFAWTMYYDTMYAFQDVDDDEKAGVKSIALLFRKLTVEEAREMLLVDRLNAYRKERLRIRLFLWAMGGSHLLLMGAAGVRNYLDGPFYLAQIFALGMMVSQVSHFEPLSRQSCWEAFVANRTMGLILAVGIVLSIVFQPKMSNRRRKPAAKE